MVGCTSKSAEEGISDGVEGWKLEVSVKNCKLEVSEALDTISTLCE